MIDLKEYAKKWIHTYIHTNLYSAKIVRTNLNRLKTFRTHRITVQSVRIPGVSCKEVLGAFTVWTQAERSGSIVDNHITRVACTVTNTGVWTRAATHTVGLTWLTPLPLICVCWLWTLDHTVRAILFVAAWITVICLLHSARHTGPLR